MIVGSTDHNVYALDLKTGALKWKFDADAPVTSAPVVTDENVIITTSVGYVYALDKDRSPRWTFKAGYDATASVAGETVIVVSSDTHVYALDLRDGSLKWKFKAEEPIETAPVITSNTVVVGSSDPHVYALSLENGKLKWKTTIRRGVACLALACL